MPPNRGFSGILDDRSRYGPWSIYETGTPALRGYRRGSGARARCVLRA